MQNVSLTALLGSDVRELTSSPAFVQMIRLKKTRNLYLQGLALFFRVYLYKPFWFAFSFLFFVPVVCNCQHCSVHNIFCKQEKLSNVIYTLNI
jgi:hypothetical protein